MNRIGFSSPNPSLVELLSAAARRPTPSLTSGSAARPFPLALKMPFQHSGPNPPSDHEIVAHALALFEGMDGVDSGSVTNDKDEADRLFTRVTVTQDDDLILPAFVPK